MKKNEGWTYRWKQWLKPTKLPGVWLRQEGGHFVRGRATDPATGEEKEIKKVLPEADEVAALSWLEAERRRVRSGAGRAQQRNERFADFAEWLYQEKIKPGGGKAGGKNGGAIRSAKGRQHWQSTLKHLIGGTAGAKADATVTGFGEFFVDRLTSTHIEDWRTNVYELINAGDYSPTTCHGWFRILQVITKAMKRHYKLPVDPCEGVANFDLTNHVPRITEEAPNALPVERVGRFLELLLEHYPQHYAMTFFGFTTGLRPSSLRPLRRRGPEPDVQWDKSRVAVRRSQTVGQEVMNNTKQGRRYTIDLPAEALDVLRWHVDTQLSGDQLDSDLLFPSVIGGYRSPNVLNKAFADIADRMDLGFPFTQKGMRRTFNDLVRAAAIEKLISRSISGHLTEQMQDHYSTVAPAEQRQCIAKVISLFGSQSGAPSRSGGAPGGAPSLASGAPGLENRRFLGAGSGT